MKSRITRIVAAGAALAAGTAASAQAPALSNSADVDQVRAIVAEMMADAQTRTSLLQSGATAGHDGKFFLSSADGSFRLNMGGQLITRYMITSADDAGPGNDDFETGFVIPRATLEFSGNIFEPGFIYRLSTNFSSNGGGAVLEDAYFGKAWDNGWVILGGQLRMPVLWEDIVKVKHSLAVDQSVVNAIFGQDRSQGAWVHYKADAWRMWAGVDDGVNSANTAFDSPNEADYALTSRWELKFAGDWSQFDAFSSPRGSEFASKLGVAAHFQSGPDQPGSPNNNVLAYTADLMFEGDGWNLFAYGVGYHIDQTGSGPDLDNFGFLVQGGFFVAEKAELFARYDLVLADDSYANDDPFNTVTVGVNYYFHGQAAKFTFDVVWYLDSTASNDLVQALATGAIGGNRASNMGLIPTDGDNEVSFRAQFQILF